jgi:hypothetical protein
MAVIAGNTVLGMYAVLPLCNRPTSPSRLGSMTGEAYRFIRGLGVRVANEKQHQADGYQTDILRTLPNHE